MQDGRSYIRQYTVLYLSILIGRDINKRNGIQRVGRIRRTVLVQGMVGITVVGNDDYLVIVGFGSFHRIFHTFVDSFYGFLNGFVNTGVTHHIAVRIIHYDEIELLGIDGLNQFIFYFVSTHFRFQVIRSHLRRRNKDTFFRIIRSFATAVEEECHVGVLLRFGNMELGLAVGCQVFAQGILYVFLIEENVHTLEGSIVRSHAIILQTGNSVHSLLGHILLSKHDSQFLGTVVTIVEEDNHITFFDGTVYGRVIDRFDEFVCNTFII